MGNGRAAIVNLSYPLQGTCFKFSYRLILGVDDVAGCFQSYHTQDRRAAVRTKNNSNGNNFSHELDLRRAVFELYALSASKFIQVLTIWLDTKSLERGRRSHG